MASSLPRTYIQTVRFVLDVIGRADLCKRVDDYTAQNPDSMETHTRTGSLRKALSWVEEIEETSNPVAVAVFKIIREALHQHMQGKSKSKHSGKWGPFTLRRGGAWYMHDVC